MYKMALAKLRYLTEDEVLDVADPILRAQWSQFGYTNSEVFEVEDFDGAFIFRMNAHVTQKVPAKYLIDANHDIHIELRKLGENRFVILSTVLPQGDTLEVDEDEE